MLKRKKILVVTVVFFGGLIGFNLIKGIMIKRYFAHYEIPPVTVSSVNVAQTTWVPQQFSVGNFLAINGVEVNSQTSGNVVNIHFESGQFVAKNTLLIDIDDNIELATLNYNQAELHLTDLNYQRQVDLYRRGATPGISLDEAHAKWLQAQASVEKIQASIRQKHITTPFAGQLGIRQVNLGEYMTPGKAIVTLQSLDPLYLEFYLPEQQLSHVAMHQPMTFSVEQLPHLLFYGQITAINSKVDNTTHNIQIQATIPNCPADVLTSPLITATKQADSQKTLITCHSDLNTQHQIQHFSFLPGMFAAIQLSDPPIKNAIVIPSTAIAYTLYGTSVFVIEKEKDRKDAQGNPYLHVKQTYVHTGGQHGNSTLITHGLKAGQQIVTVGEMKLENGTRVMINNDIPLPLETDLEHLGQ